ncbi:TonB-dependent receptor domain-containing protein [Flavobacterium difficile]|uniref:TonB-dependent receptor n=1 Tax=Flavobacterium difficile TaxID=2709659 RepID=A0ABX0I163_9FLAO|nr:TonB-dependent receptor [Flavobacterium difficile]NHM00921.1 TonB-dependent receptor [Flavobacterium difficile]
MKIILKSLLITVGFTSVVLAQDTTKVKKEDGLKEAQIEEVKIVKQKKAIEQKPDRTIFNIADQPNLNSGTLMETIKQLPGLIASDVAGMMYQGKQLDVFLDGRPLNISSNELNSFLEGMPANSVERIEVITQPGAEFPATSGGAILNIITNKNAKKYLSATYTSSSAFNTYDKTRYRTYNSVLLNAKNKYFGWQLNFGQNYRENAVWSEFLNTSNQTILSKTESDRINRTQFLKSGITIDLKKDRLLLNYDVNKANSNSETDGFGLGFTTLDLGKSHNTRQDATITYQKRFDDKSQKLDFVFNYNNNKNDFNLFSNVLGNTVLDNYSNQNYYNGKFDYSQGLKILDEGKVSFGALYEKLLFEAENFNTKNLEYERVTAATYLEFQAKYNKFDFILGSRAEKYEIGGKTNTTDLIPFDQLRWFPNATIQYNVTSQIFLNVNYNKKITLPSTSALNPNNTTYQNQNINTVGNPNLQPTIFDNFEVKISAFDYAYIGYNLSNATNQVVQQVRLNGNVVQNSNFNVSEVKIHNFNFALPLPYMLFTKGLKETMKFDFNPDKINFLYLYTGYQLHQIPNLETKGFWNFNLMSQIVLPKEIKFITEFGTITSGGNYFYFVADKPFNNYIDVTFSKKFLNDQLTLTIFGDDIFNMNRSYFRPVNEPLLSYNKNDTRKFGFTLNYKLPTKNKAAKIEQNILKEDKKEEGGTVIGN